MVDQMPAVIIAAITGGIVVVAMIMTIPWLAISTYHKRKLEEIKSRQQAAIGDETRLAIESLRSEIAALRDTSTQYDVSFDTALSRMDNRLMHLEQRVGRVEQAVESVPIRS